MNNRVAKKTRRTAKRIANKQFVQMLRSIGRLPFKKRLWFAWKIIKGVRPKAQG